MPTTHSTPNATSTDMSASTGFAISRIDHTGHWLGWKWSRVAPAIVHATPLTGPMTEPEARTWLAEVAG
jgi:hypothetical protein